MSSARPLFVHGSGRKGMSLRWRMGLCLDLHLSKICKFRWKKVQMQKFLWSFQIYGLSPRGQPGTPTSGMCIGG